VAQQTFGPVLKREVFTVATWPHLSGFALGDFLVQVYALVSGIKYNRRHYPAYPSYEEPSYDYQPNWHD